MNIYDFNVKKVNKEEISLSAYKGKVLLIVNTATKCGHTPQYEGLEKLYEEYQAQGFEILDFPCNQFLFQAPGSDEEIAAFCQMKYNTKFETFSKIEVNGKNAHPLYTFLKENAPKEIMPDGTLDEGEDKKIKWNFTKFLIGKEGDIIARFNYKVKPDALEQYIVDALK